jgi:hypothetical protein
MRVAGATPPHVAAGVLGLSLDLREHLAGALAGHRDLDPGLALESVHGGAAPLLLHGAIHHQSALGLRCGCGDEAQGGEAAGHG